MWSLSRQGSLRMGLLTGECRPSQLHGRPVPGCRATPHPACSGQSAARFPLSLASTPMCFRARHLSFSLPSHHNPQGAACNPQRPLNLHTWMHCTPGWGVGKRVASPKISWSPANHVTARLQPRCSRVHTLRGQKLTAE